MATIKLIRLEVIDATGDISSIDFGEKLTIINGPSSTGKTWIFKCIKFVFGCIKSPFSLQGYKAVSLLLKAGEGQILLRRDFGADEIIVDDRGTDLNLKKIWSVDENGKLFGTILGVPADFTLPFNSKGNLRPWDWNIFLEPFMLKQGSVTTEKSVILSKTSDYDNMFLKAMLIHALFGESFNEYKEGITIEEAEKVRYAKQTMDGEKLKLSTVINELKSELEGFPDVEEFQPVIAELEIEASKIQSRIQSYYDQEKNLRSECDKLEREILEVKGQIDRYGALQSQYEADLIRLNFTVNNQSGEFGHTEGCKCPLCNHTLESEPDTELALAAKAEVENIVMNLKDLNGAVEALAKRLDELEEELDSKLKEIESIKTKRRAELPRKKNVNELLAEYNDYLETKAKLEAYEAVYSSVGADLEVKARLTPPKNYVPSRYFKNDFSSTINLYITDIMLKSNYPWDANIYFQSKDSFNFTVDGKPKEEYSFGYVSHFNSVVWLAFIKYFNEISKVKTGFTFIDSPLLGLHENVESVSDQEGIRHGFYLYLANNIDDGNQMIVVENTTHEPIPNEIRQMEGIKFVDFTKDEKRGRYGFLNKLREIQRKS